PGATAPAHPWRVARLLGPWRGYPQGARRQGAGRLMTAYIIDAIRAPRGKGREGGGLNSLRPLDILGQLYGALGDRTGVDPGDVAEVVLGCVTQTGEQGGNIAQTSALHAGWGVRGSAFTVNSFCTSGLTACAD